MFWRAACFLRGSQARERSEPYLANMPTRKGHTVMKTKIVKKCDSPNKEHLILDPPYTVFGHSVLLPSFSVVMKVGGLKQMIKDLDDEDSLRIELFHDKATEYSYIKNSDRG